MSNVLSYSSGERRAGCGLASVWFAGVACGLMLFAWVCYRVFAAPALAKDLASYHEIKTWLVLLPAWVGIVLALVALILAIIGFFERGRSRRWAIVGLAGCGIFVWLAVLN